MGIVNERTGPSTAINDHFVRRISDANQLG